MPKKHMVYLIKSVVFIIIFSVLLFFVNYIFLDKTELQFSSTLNNEPKDTIDIVFLGSSETITSIQPMQLWNDYGFASYNLATSATYLPTTYHAARLAIEKQHPSLMVVDVTYLYINEKTPLYPRFHKLVDCMNFDEAKYTAIRDLIPPDDRFEFYFPLYAYHSRWSSLKSVDFQPINDPMKGSVMYFGLNQFDFNPAAVDISVTEPIGDISFEYIEKIIELCDQNDVKLLFWYPPTYGLYSALPDNGVQKIFNSFSEYCEKNELNFIDGYHNPDMFNLDYMSDFNDDVHVNAYGAKKITSAIGKYICDNYDLPDRKNDERYKSWHDDYAEFISIVLASDPNYLDG